MCPLISAKFGQLQERFAGSDTHLVEITLDPQYDRPAILEKYAQVFGAKDARWTLGTGDTNDVLNFSAQFGILLAPTIEYGVNVVTERGFIGNASIRKKTLHRTLNDLIDEWERDGIREFILLTAHEHDPHLEAMATVVTSGARVRVVDLFEVDMHDLLEGQGEPMHGDEVDTSLMLYFAPELVAMERAQDYMMSREALRRYRRGWLKVPRESPGSIGRPTLASAEKGRQIYERLHQRIVERVFQSRANGAK